MTNNQDDLNRLINEFTIQKQKDRKHYLRIEIAKANDRSVKRALQDILDDIEKKERRNRIVGIVVLIVILLIGFYILGVRDDNRNNGIIKKTSTSTLQSVEESSTDEVIEEVVREKNLSEDEVKQWVEAVWQKRYQKIADMPEVNFHVYINDSDNLVYINVAPPQTDVVDVFRINANGELEESGRFITTANYNDWIVISKEFLDTSQVQVKEPTMPSSEVEVTNLTAKEFAEYYAKCYKITYPIMSIEEYTEKYGHIKEYDDSIQIITYTDYSSVENSVQCGIITPYRTAKSFYIYDNSDKKAYLIRNNASGETEFIPELTDYISNSR